MKSKRAKQYITGKVAAFMYPGKPEECDLKLKDAKRAVELAEEDMAEKASQAFCAVHCPKGCPFDNSDGCGSLREFKLKMD